jgi:hypothetical protein
LSARAAKAFNKAGSRRRETRSGSVSFDIRALYAFSSPVELRRRNARSVTILSDLLVGNVRRHALNPSL